MRITGLCQLNASRLQGLWGSHRDFHIGVKHSPSGIALGAGHRVARPIHLPGIWGSFQWSLHSFSLSWSSPFRWGLLEHGPDVHDRDRNVPVLKGGARYSARSHGGLCLRSRTREGIGRFLHGGWKKATSPPHLRGSLDHIADVLGVDIHLPRIRGALDERNGAGRTNRNPPRMEIDLWSSGQS